jgi:putative MATE family efflux protein
VTYLSVNLFGLPSMLVVLAATGALRGLKDTRPPLLATGFAAVINVPLNLVLVYPLGLGVAGSALGTVIAQTGAAVWLCAVVVRGARLHRAPLRLDRPGIVAAAAAIVPLLARTILLRIALLTMTFVAAAQGDVAIASHQIAFTLWYLLAMPPESFAIVSQAMVGHALRLGPGGSKSALLWGFGSGLAIAMVLVAMRPVYIPIFTEDLAVRDLVWSLALVVAASQPVGALLYVTDGILMAPATCATSPGRCWWRSCSSCLWRPSFTGPGPGWWRCGGLWPVGCWHGWSPWLCATGRARGSAQDPWRSRQAGVFSRWSPPPQRRPRSRALPRRVLR